MQRGRPLRRVLRSTSTGATSFRPTALRRQSGDSACGSRRRETTSERRRQVGPRLRAREARLRPSWGRSSAGRASALAAQKVTGSSPPGSTSADADLRESARADEPPDHARRPPRGFPDRRPTSPSSRHRSPSRARASSSPAPSTCRSTPTCGAGWPTGRSYAPPAELGRRCPAGRSGRSSGRPPRLRRGRLRPGLLGLAGLRRLRGRACAGSTRGSRRSPTPGILGMPGMTAYVALLDVGRPRRARPWSSRRPRAPSARSPASSPSSTAAAPWASPAARRSAAT